MTNVEILEKLEKYFSEKVCPKITLKKPNDEVVDDDYMVEYVHPSAFAMYAPATEDMMPLIPAPCPSICIQIIEGNDDLKKMNRRIDIRLSMSVWNPGIHTFENVYPKEGMKYMSSDIADTNFSRNMDGWKDAMNFTDMILSELTRVSNMCGLNISKETPVKYGLYNQDGEIFDFYPYYFSYINFSLECGVVRTVPESYQNLL